jgi:Protein of unknown function (DUF2934)
MVSRRWRRALATATLAAATKDVRKDEQRIAERAYLLWENAGRPEGRSEEFWSEATQQETYGEPLQPSRAYTPPLGPEQVKEVVTPVRRALYLCTILHQYGGDLTPKDTN